MATYTDTSTLNTGQDDPINAPLMTALRDNPVAIAEGASGAPKVEAAALNILLLDGQGTVTDLDRVATVLLTGQSKVDFTSGSGTASFTVRYRLSSDSGTTWGSYVTASTNDERATHAVHAVITVGPTNNAIEVNYQSSTTGDGSVSTSTALIGLAGVSP